MSDKKAYKAPFAGAVKGTVVKFSPFDVAIMGGLDLPEAERGPLDTKTDKAHPLYDERLKLRCTAEWVANIRTHGVKVGLQLVLIGGVPFVENGRQRVRGARVASAGLETAIELTGTVVAEATDLDMLRDMIVTNVYQEDSTAIKIAKLKRLLALSGNDIDGAAKAFAIKPATVKAWLAYDASAVKAVKEAVNSGKIPSTTGMDLARLPADKQDEALAAVLATNKDPEKASQRGGNAATNARIIATAAGKNPGIKDRKTMKRFQEALDGVDHPKGTTATDLEWYQGASDAISLILGAEEVDPRLAAILKALDTPKEAAEAAPAPVAPPEVKPAPPKKAAPAKKPVPPKKAPPAKDVPPIDDGDTE